MTGFKSKKAMGTNLCKEIIMPASVYLTFKSINTIKLPHNMKYQFSRAKWHKADLWNSDHRMDEVREWCVEQFGPQDHNPDAWSRWTNSMNSTFRFRDQKDYNWFVLRWGA